MDAPTGEPLDSNPNLINGHHQHQIGDSRCNISILVVRYPKRLARKMLGGRARPGIFPVLKLQLIPSKRNSIT
jgi:hypothetical protein